MKMTPDELSRRIAEFLEPSPTWAKHRRMGRDALSDNGMWWIEIHRIGSANLERLGRHPRNMIEDPEMTVMLLEKMEQVELHRGSDGWIIYPAVPVQYEDETLYRYGQILQKDLRLAIAQAFAFANGLVTKEELT